MIILPQSIADMKDSNSVFFVNLVILHFITGDVYLAALDVDVDWKVPGTNTPAKYLSMPLQIGTITKSADDKVDNVELTISNVTEIFSSALFQATDFRGTMVSILQIAYPGSLSDGTQFKYIFYGYMDEPSLDEANGIFKTTILPVVPNMESYRTLSLTCDAWYGDSEECGATKTTMSGTAGSNSTQYSVTSSSFVQAENFWRNGVITIGWEARKIKSSTAGKVIPEYPFFSETIAGEPFTIEDGCDGSTADCTRHSNRMSYGGFLSIPTELIIKT